MTGITGPEEPDRGKEEALAIEAGRRLRRGVIVSGGAVVILSLTTSVSFWDALGIPFFFLLLPAAAVAQLPLLRSEPIERVPVYLGSAAAILVLGAVGLLLGLRVSGWEGMGLGLPSASEMVTWTAGLTVAGVAWMGILAPLDRRFSPDRERFLLELLPRTPREKGVFGLLSLAAGLGEELAYRGYALISLQLLGTGAWEAAVGSSIAFGILHAYQGRIGILRTGAMGLLLAVPVVLTGSLVPSIVAHVLIDLVGGLVLGPRMIRRADRGGAGPLVLRFPHR